MMCGRYTLATPAEKLALLFDLPGPLPTLPPRYNVAPSQAVAVVGLKPDGTTRGLVFLRWGLVPSWSETPASGPRPINARSDSLHKPTFRAAFRSKRCLVLADGFYEWQAVGKKKVPFHFRMTDRAPFALAGLWEHWTDGTAKLVTCCHITVDANAVVAPVHDRMPAILPPDGYTPWLSNDTPEAELKALLAPYPADAMEAVEVSPAVNSPRNDDPRNVQQVGGR